MVVKLHEAGMLEVPLAAQRASRGAILDEWCKQGCSKVKSRPWKNLTKIRVRVDVHAKVQRCGSVPAWGVECSITVLLLVLPHYFGPVKNIGKKYTLSEALL